MIRWVALATLLCAGPATGTAGEADTAPGPAASLTPAQGKNIVYLMSVDGESPPDSSSRGAFVAGVRAVFDADRYLTERSPVRGSRTGHSGPPTLSLPLGNRFQLVRGDPFGDEWQVTVTVMAWLPGKADSLRGVRVNVAVLSPEAVAVGARPLPVREDLILHLPSEPRDPWFWQAGRMAGLLAVEELHHQSGDLAEDTRVRLDRTERRPVVVRRPPTPRR